VVLPEMQSGAPQSSTTHSLRRVRLPPRPPGEGRRAPELPPRPPPPDSERGRCIQSRYAVSHVAQPQPAMLTASRADSRSCSRRLPAIQEERRHRVWWPSQGRRSLAHRRCGLGLQHARWGRHHAAEPRDPLRGPLRFALRPRANRHAGASGGARRAAVNALLPFIPHPKVNIKSWIGFCWSGSCCRCR